MPRSSRHAPTTASLIRRMTILLSRQLAGLERGAVADTPARQHGTAARRRKAAARHAKS